LTDAEAKRLEIIESVRGQLIAFGRAIMPKMYQVESAPFHYKLASILLDRTKNKQNIIAPRGFAKSSIAAGLLPLYHLTMEDPGQDKFVVLVSKTEEHAVRLLSTIKDVLNYSPYFRALFGYWGEHSAKSWKTNEIILKDGTMMLAKGTGQQVVGLKNISQRPTLMILDDPEDMANTRTEEAMEYNLKWLLQSLVPARDAQRGRVVVIGTPQHQRSMVMMLKKASDWTSHHYRAIQEDGTSLWPAQWPIEKLEQERKSLEEIGRVSVFYREYMCEVIGDEEQLFKPHFMQRYEGHLVDKPEGHFLRIVSLNGKTLLEPEDRPVTIFMGIDPASSIQNDRDFSTIVPLAVDKNWNRFVLPYFRRRVSPMKLGEHILEYYHRLRPNRTVVETVGYQEMLRDWLRTQARIPGIEVGENPRTKKSKRLESLEPLFATKKVWFLDDQESMRNEFLLFPRGDHDDLMDGFYYANKRAFRPTHEGDNRPRGSFIFDVDDEDGQEMLA
jgi:hypothetical protein